MAAAELVERALANLRRIDFVGVSEDLGGLYARIAGPWRLPPVPTLARLNTRERRDVALVPARPATVTAAAEALIERMTALDRPVYALARQLAELG